jgi:predicted RNA binding protein YcfA (HicA-like mRNA interferase family)
MKLPRNISGQELVKILTKLGYEKVQQKGSHIKVTTNTNGQHHLAIPNHSPIRTGTLNSILRQVSNHFGKTKEEIIQILF